MTAHGPGQHDYPFIGEPPQPPQRPCDILQLEVEALHPNSAARVATIQAANEPHRGEWFAEAVYWVAETEQDEDES